MSILYGIDLFLIYINKWKRSLYCFINPFEWRKCMYVIVGVLLTPIFMVLMAPSIGTLWLLMSIGWATKDYNKPEKPDMEESGPVTNKAFKWLWWLSSSAFYKIFSRY